MNELEDLKDVIDDIIRTLYDKDVIEPDEKRKLLKKLWDNSAF